MKWKMLEEKWKEEEKLSIKMLISATQELNKQQKGDKEDLAHLTHLVRWCCTGLTHMIREEEISFIWLVHLNPCQIIGIRKIRKDELSPDSLPPFCFLFVHQWELKIGLIFTILVVETSGWTRNGSFKWVNGKWRDAYFPSQIAGMPVGYKQEEVNRN